MRMPDLSLGNVRWRLANGRVHASNAWYRAAGRRIHGTRQQYRNWLNRRAIARGKGPLPGRVTSAIGSRTPVYRNRINPATGRRRRDELRNVPAQVERLRSHVRDRNQAFQNGDIPAANEAHERWHRAYVSAPRAVRRSYQNTPWTGQRPAPLFGRTPRRQSR